MPTTSERAQVRRFGDIRYTNRETKEKVWAQPCSRACPCRGARWDISGMDTKHPHFHLYEGDFFVHFKRTYPPKKRKA